jgi:hypothetical protein
VAPWRPLVVRRGGSKTQAPRAFTLVVSPITLIPHLVLAHKIEGLARTRHCTAPRPRYIPLSCLAGSMCRPLPLPDVSGGATVMNSASMGFGSTKHG